MEMERIDKTMSKRTWILVVVLLALGGAAGGLGGAVGTAHSVAAAAPRAAGAAALPAAAGGLSCDQLSRFGVDRQLNMHAAQLLRACGQAGAGDTVAARIVAQPAAGAAGPAYGGADVLVNNALADTFPHVTQDESAIAANGADVVISYLSSTNAPSLSGLSVSHDGGATFTELRPSPFNTGHGTNYGKAAIVYSALDSSWYAANLADGCGGQGIGLWKSNNAGNDWAAISCGHSGMQDDAPSLAADNGPGSPFAGRLYLAWNDFTLNQPNSALVVSSSSNGGATWSTPVVLTGTAPSIVRDVQVLTDYAGGGNVYVVANDENGGGLNARTHLLYRSVDGGASWSALTIAGAQPAPGADTCPSQTYFARIAPIWRTMGAGQPASGPGSVLHYVFGIHGADTDPGDVVYVRSTDDGLTWSAPFRLNTDTGGLEQWMPALSVNADGTVVASWYDRRNTTAGGNYEYWARVSTDNGQTWGADEAVSDVLIDQPDQPDPLLSGCYAGDYNYQAAGSGGSLLTWTDGRLAIPDPQGTPVAQQDIRLDRVGGSPPSATPTGTPGGPTFTPTPPPSATPTATPTACGGGDYVITTGTATLVPAPNLVPNTSCDDCAVTVPLPFAYTLYDTTTTSVVAYADGVLGMTGINQSPFPVCLPDPASQDVIFVLWQDLDLSGTNHGIYTSTTGTAPNRVFNLEWRGTLFQGGPIDFEARLYEGQTKFDLIYDTVTGNGQAATVGVQDSSTGPFTQFECSTGGVTAGLRLTFTRPTCGTPTASPTPTPTVPCVANYTFAAASATLVAGSTDVGLHCDNCVVDIPAPFPIRLYDQDLPVLRASSNGLIGDPSVTGLPASLCLPTNAFGTVIAAYWDDLRTDQAGQGVYTALSGSYPNRVFTVEWRASRVAGGTVDFEVRFYEGATYFDVVYGATANGGATATTGVQDDPAGLATQFSCSTASLTAGLRVRYTLPGCLPPTSTPPLPPVPSPPVPLTATPVPSDTPVPTDTPAVTATATPCLISFSDVDPSNPFYTFVRCLACRGILNGYADGTFKPNNRVTRGQIAKIVANAAGFGEPVPPAQQTFEDVPNSNPFWIFIERVANHGIINGYTCGGPGEPCVPPGNRPYFRPSNSATRSQLAKIVASAAGYSDPIPAARQTFEDVPNSNPFWLFIERVAFHGAISGYTCGGQNEPCIPPGNRPYFRPYNSVTRGQTAKIVANVFFPNCRTP